jgi:hypothetical protein
MNLPITHENIHDWFPSPHTENPMAGEPWWQVQAIGLMTALQLMRLLPDTDYRQQALVELRRGLDTGLLSLVPPTDEEVRKRLAQTLAPFCPSPLHVVVAMLDLAVVGPGERLVDLGSGDGRVVFAAANRGAHAHGIEVDASLVAQAREASRWPVECTGSASFEHGMVEDADLSNVDVVTCYLVSTTMHVIGEKMAQMKPGTRVVSHGFPIPDREPAKTVSMEDGSTVLYLWIV